MGDETPRGRLARCRICASDGAGFGESGRGKWQQFWGAEIISKISNFFAFFSREFVVELYPCGRPNLQFFCQNAHMDGVILSGSEAHQRGLGAWNIV